MFGLEGAGKLLILAGVLLALVGLLLTLWPRLALMGRLPGYMLIQRDGFRLFFPLATCIEVSLILTRLLNLMFKLLR